LDDLFIDWVDIEWSFRAGRAQYAHFMLPNAVMHHTIGDDFVDIGVTKINIHNDIRKYYIIRNACHLLISKEMNLGWRINTALKISVYMVIYLFISKNRLKLFNLILTATMHGFSGRLGKAALFK
jgi:rhamnosyltransferase